MIVCYWGNVEVVKLLVKLGVNVNFVLEEGMVLLVVVYYDNIELVKFLLDY